MTKAERTVGTPDQTAGEPVDDQDRDDQGMDRDAGREPGAAGDSDPADGPDEQAGDTTADQAETAGPPDPATRGPRRIPALFGVAALAYALDITSKTLVVHHLEHRPAIELLGSYLQLDAVRNSGAAFGIGQGMTIVFTLIALIVIGVIARLARRLYSVPWAIALGLLLGGALGNLTDRLFRAPGTFQGAVVDFIAPKDFAVFNLADSAIVCGGILIVWLSFRGLDPDGSVHRD